MHAFTFFAGLGALATSFRTVSAVGISCRGSALCELATFDNSNLDTIVQLLRDAVWASSKDNSTVYNSGEHIVCVGVNQPISIIPGVTKSPVTGSVSITGNIHEGGICLFPQGSALTLEQIRPLTNSVLEHGCSTCGSIPVHYVDQKSNDTSAGILTFDHVKNPYCDGNCISATGGTKSRIRRGIGSYALQPIHA
ncbi:hypothetical protein MMC07_002570 [Pseudocyphellaria aurata]|nr:hypothetical protein [Pseudocyphellaria aurata]